MKKLNFLAYCSLIIFTITSCSKDDSGPSYGDTSGDYWPMSVNNEWVYDNNGEQSSTKLIGTDNFGGTTYYRVLDESILGIQAWIAKKGGTYFQKTGDLDLSQSGLTMTMKGYEIQMFRDYLAVNETWKGSTKTKVTYSYLGQSGTSDVKINYDGIILERDATATINNVVYSNVIKCKLNLEMIMEGESDIYEFEYWFAKDIGPIYQKTTNSGTTDELNLISYVLN